MTEKIPKTEPIEPNKGTERFRPYARLISVLGDQLITSKLVGVIELVKNSYDADADQVNVRFINFNESGQSPVIEIEDDGDGMTLEVIQNVWMKPATPNKLNRKRSSEKRFTNRGRVMQGDKGVGRFAIYKLGNLIEIFTKTEKSDEVKLTLNFREYAQNDEFGDKEEFNHKFLDEIENEWVENKIPERITNEKQKGTLIRISDLRNDWNCEDLVKLQPAFQRMIPPVIPNFNYRILRDFDIQITWNGSPFSTASKALEEIITQAPYSFEGKIDEKGRLNFTYQYRKQTTIGELDFFAPSETDKHDVWKMPKFREQFLEFKEPATSLIIKKRNGSKVVPKKEWAVKRWPISGPCSFYFYAFDLRPGHNDLSANEIDIVKDNSVYLYRDFTRVYPYGEKGVDWLLLSKMRAEDRAGRYFSYNDLVGFVFISQENNPLLRDQASREGLVNINGASDDFVALIQATLKVMKDFVDVDKIKNQLRKQKAFNTANKKFADAFEQLKKQLSVVNDQISLTKAQKLFEATNVLVEQYKERLTISEELAGLGMAVEKSSHDIFMLLNKMIQNSNDIVRRFENKKLSGPALKQFFEDLTESLEFLYQELQILQPLFRVSRKVVKDVSIRSTFERIERYYRREFQFDINFEIEGSDDFTIRTNLGLLLQVFINLVDNAIYWVKKNNVGKRRIRVKIDKENKRVVVGDNGPGINEDLEDIVFLEFYTTKSDFGRGLGLYIAKELLDRINANISLITLKERKVLPGANFLIQFEEGN